MIRILQETGLNAFQSRRHGLKQAVINTRSRKLRQEPLRMALDIGYRRIASRQLNAYVAAVCPPMQKKEPSVSGCTVKINGARRRTGKQDSDWFARRLCNAA
jgi:hypothetical protein